MFNPDTGEKGWKVVANIFQVVPQLKWLITLNIESLPTRPPRQPKFLVRHWLKYDAHFVLLWFVFVSL